MSSVDQEIYPITYLHENCIQYDFQTDRKFYVDLKQTFLARKLKPIKSRGYETDNTMEVKKEHTGEPKEIASVDTTDEDKDEDPPVPSITHVNNNWHSMFSIVVVFFNSQKIYNSSGVYANKSYISNKLKGAISKYKGVLHCEG